MACTVLVQSSVDIPTLADELDSASPLVIMDKALSMYGDDIAIAFRYESHPIVSFFFSTPKMMFFHLYLPSD